jgi:hypothetical protein
MHIEVEILNVIKHIIGVLLKLIKSYELFFYNVIK